ncbi:MAG: exodeoxyribonuclease VII large subunit [Lachnospiraceae bacterium]|nr:exodeoxyribonuclease VII large subunit [Lachnospiraceae bacterium]MBR5583344.1 exodeoxyribonuclease VII large subunit [Lachnospiraceae bacterium]
MRQNVYSVGQVNTYIKNMFGQDYLLNRLYVKGEVSNCKYHTSGHVYFSLKDETGAIACVMFASQRSNMKFRLAEGQKVIVLGSVKVYERDGKYQLYANEIVLDGVGLLYERFQALKKELEEMGMFSHEYKKPIPKYCKRVGVVTAPTGAAIRDIMNISMRRNPYVQLILYPALVQGEMAAPSIVKGIEALDKLGLDVIIVGRGGGSMEDLWAFNEEMVARAIFHCQTPIISAVGHETDTTIADYVSDLRAPTPSAAAELAVFNLREVIEKQQSCKMRMDQAMRNKIHIIRKELETYELRIRALSPAQQLLEKRNLAADLANQLELIMKNNLREKRFLLQMYIEKLNGLSPLKKLNQGYSFVADEKGSAVTSIDHVQENDELTIHVTDGAIKTKVIEKKGIIRV